MSLDNAINAIASWAQNAGLSTEDGRDLSPFVTGTLIVAQADGPLSDGERDQISQMYQSLTGQELDGETLRAERDWLAENGVDAAIATIAEHIESHSDRELLVSFAALVAAAEGGVNAPEGGALQKLGQGLGFSQLQVQQLLGRAMQAAGGNF
jgi:tellurite resistance protein